MKDIHIRISFIRSKKNQYYGECFFNKKNIKLVVNLCKNKTDKSKVATIYHEFTHFILDTYLKDNNDINIEDDDILPVKEELKHIKRQNKHERICRKIEQLVMKELKKYL